VHGRNDCLDLAITYCFAGFTASLIAPSTPFPSPFPSQASFLKKRMNIGGRRVDLAIWDTAGQERFHALGPIYYRDRCVCVLFACYVYSMCMCVVCACMWCKCMGLCVCMFVCCSNRLCKRSHSRRILVMCRLEPLTHT